MKKDSIGKQEREQVVAGLDVGDRFSELHVLDGTGETLETGKVASTPKGLRQRFGGVAPMRVVLEVGTHSLWMSHLLEELGHEVVVANPRQLRPIAQSMRKNDRADAETLARVGRLDINLLHPVRHRRQETQAALELIKARALLVTMRTKTVNHVRAVVKTLGERLPACSPETFVKVAMPVLPAELRDAVGPLLEEVVALNERIKAYDRKVEEVSRERYPETGALRQVPGVGPLTALAYVLVLEDPSRFGRSRDVGAYLGLVPRQRQSGQRDPQLGITHAGDRMLRSLLVQCAHYVLGYRGPESDLRRWGLTKAATGGPARKKKVVVAVARKLSVLLHRLWVTGEVYTPLREEAPMAAA